MKSKMKTACIALLAIIVWFGLVLQFYISTERFLTQGHSVAWAIVQILSFYTIQTNLLIAVALASILLAPASNWGRFFSRVSVLTAIAVYISIVGLVFEFILKGLAKLEGLFILTDFLLHTVSPILFVLFWLIFVPKEIIKWKQILPWAIFPLLYLVYSLIRGAITGLYPYHFINAANIGYKQVAINSFFVLLVFLILSTVFIAISRALNKTVTS
jgi:hypothetical protein